MSIEGRPNARVGDWVMYVLPVGPNAGESRPAIVVRTPDFEAGKINLQVFTDGHGDGSAYSSGMVRVASIERNSNEAVKNTWHFRTDEAAMLTPKVDSTLVVLDLGLAI